MLSVGLYKVLHVAGLLVAFASVGGLLALTYAGVQQSGRRWFLAFHGVGLLLGLVGGFGVLGRLGLGFPPWIAFKLAIWVCVGVAPVVARRKPKAALGVWAFVAVLGVVATALARFKPFWAG